MELLAKGEWRGLLEKMRSEWRRRGSVGGNPGSYLPNPYGGTTDGGDGSNDAPDAGVEPATTQTPDEARGERPTT